METVNVSGLKNNPTDALRKAQDDLVLVMKRDQPHALVVGLDATGALGIDGVRIALATALFREGHLSLARSAKVAQMTLQSFMAHLSRLGIPVVQLSAADVERDMDTLQEWLASS